MYGARLALLLLLPALAAASFVSCPNATAPPLCQCRLRPQVECRLRSGGWPASSGLTCASPVIGSAAQLSVRCSRWHPRCPAVSLSRALAPGRRSLALDSCAIPDVEALTVTPPSRIQWKLRFGLTAIFQGHPALFAAPHIPLPRGLRLRSSLEQLAVRGCRLTRLPTRLLLSGSRLRRVDFSRNLLAGISSFEFQVLFANSSIKTAVFDDNAIHSFGDHVMEDVLLKMKSNFLNNAHRLEKNLVKYKGFLGGLSRALVAPVRLLRSIFTDSAAFPLRKTVTTLDRHKFKLFFADRPAVLEELSLSGNRLTALPPVLMGFNSIHTLRLARNRLERLFEPKLGDVVLRFLYRSLRVLDLAGNSLITVGADLLKVVPQLQRLILSNNRLEAFAAGPGARKLRELHLDGNRLRSVSFRWTSRLLHLNLSHNRLDMVDAHLTRGLTAVEVLDLSFNAITHLAPGVLRYLRHLRRLDLSGNRLSVLHAAAFRCAPQHSLGTRPRLLLAGNAAPLACDCRSFLPLAEREEAAADWLRAFVFPALQSDAGLRCRHGRGRPTGFPALLRGPFRCRFGHRTCGPRCLCCTRPSCGCVRHCPRSCRCSHGVNFTDVAADCSRASLIGAPRDLDPTTVTLRLDMNPLGSLGPATLDGRQFGNVRVLNASLCGLQTIAAGAFDSLYSLRVLLLDNNDLSSLPRGLFTSLRLHALSLSYNRLRTLNLGALAPLGASLRRLDLRGNPWRCGCVRAMALGRWLDVKRSQAAVPRLSCALEGPLRRAANGRERAELSPGGLAPLCRRQRATAAAEAARSVHARNVEVVVLAGLGALAAFVLSLGLTLCCVRRQRRARRHGNRSSTAPVVPPRTSRLSVDYEEEEEAVGDVTTATSDREQLLPLSQQRTTAGTRQQRQRETAVGGKQQQQQTQ